MEIQSNSMRKGFARICEVSLAGREKVGPLLTGENVPAATGVFELCLIKLRMVEGL
jgi:hypothetical protein